MSDPYKVVRDFESALCDYTGAKYSVAVTSCTAALMLAVAWNMRGSGFIPDGTGYASDERVRCKIPKRTYIGVPMSIVHAGGRPVFDDFNWSGGYPLAPFPVWDYARRFTSNMFNEITAYEINLQQKAHGYVPKMLCVSFHHTKILGLAAHGGAILHDNDEADEWLRRARFDGRKEGVSPKDDTFPMIGWHCYMTPATAAEGLMRLAALPKHNDDLPLSDYPDLSQLEIFK